MISDDEIRAAFEHVASRAPAPARLQRGLAARARVHRQRRVLLATGGAVGLAAVVGGPAALLWQAKTGYLPFLGPGPDDVRAQADVRTLANLAPAPTEPPPGTGNVRVPLRYGPTWMLDGYVEVQREASLAGPTYQLREWRPAAPTGEDQPFIRVMLAPESLFPIGDWRRSISVNGGPAWLSPKVGQFPQVIWAVGDGLNLSVGVYGVGDDARVAQWVARSIVAETVAGVECPIRFGWLPDGLRAGLPRISLRRLEDGWAASASLLLGRTEQLLVAVGPKVDALPQAFHPAQLRGRLGEIAMTGGGLGSADVDLDQGLRLAVLLSPLLSAGTADPGSPGAPVAAGATPLATTEELIRLIDDLTIGPIPYLGWLGQR